MTSRWTIALAGLVAVMACAQPTVTNPLAIGKMSTVKATVGSTVQVKVPVEIMQGFHVNSNVPEDEYLIPLRLTWEEDNPMTAGMVKFPTAVMENYSFSPTPLSVFTENFQLETTFTVPADATPGPTAINGKLRYQACNDRECLAPKTLNVAVQVDIVR